MNKQVLLSGIAPTGNFHIGNYLGAIKQWVELQKTHNVFAMIADLHAITTPQEPKKLYDKSAETFALLIACGLNPKKSVVFIQSQVPAHAELGWILNTLTPVGELERMTQFKEKRLRTGTLAGLLNYPVLQAADILLYQTDVVPVGEDQLQHLELARSLARKFNSRFGKTFKEPKALVQEETARIMSLQNPAQKMSKSTTWADNHIALLDSPAEIRRKMKSAITDSGKEVHYDQEFKPAISNLISIHSAFSGMSYREIEKKYRGKGYAEFKNDLAELLVKKLAPIQKKFLELSKNKKVLLALIKQGAKKANLVASQTLSVVKKKVGLVL